ncbi:hypothetical protein GQ55_2G486400 [Panicum hallii var. hallii]|uniref:Uncharacterized protein n=1 Tax=Panicum hallii var. hallii TaxID=1504633 RepID=A0A2T7F0I4_9POAL|nr:hypothetical protein GQ55_2G486400 [Panicum hallii var. hallii]
MRFVGPTPSPPCSGRAVLLRALKWAATRRSACRRPQAPQSGGGSGRGIPCPLAHLLRWRGNNLNHIGRGRARDKEVVESEQQGGADSSWSGRDGRENRKHGRKRKSLGHP